MPRRRSSTSRLSHTPRFASAFSPSRAAAASASPPVSPLAALAARAAAESVRRPQPNGYSGS